MKFSQRINQVLVSQELIVSQENMVEGDGFEPSKAEPADLQSAPFGHSGTPPGCFPNLLQEKA